MSSKFLAAALMSTAFLTSAAFAQTPAAPDNSTKSDSMKSDSTTSAPAAKDSDSAATSTKSDTKQVQADTSRNGTWRASKVIGLSVYNDSNESVGSINELLTDDKGNVKAVVIGVGGFLGIGEHNVAVDFDKVKFVKEPMVYAGAGGAGSGGKMATGSSSSSSSTTTGSSSGSSSSGATAAPTAKPNPWYPDHAVYSATKDQLKAMPDLKYTTD